MKRIALIALSAFLLILSFPNFNLEFLAWFALIPLFFAVDNQKPLRAFALSYICGSLFFLGTVYWLIHVTLPGMVAVALYLALYFGLFGLIASYSLRLKPHHSLIFVPAAWVALELARSHFLTGFGWNLLAHSQSYTPVAIQIADIFGAYGVSFLIILVNIGIFIAIKQSQKKENALTYFMIVLFVIYLAFAYGTFRLKNIFTGENLRVAIVQGNIPQTKKWDAAFREEILSKYERLTREAAAQKPDIIVWPETSVPGFLESEEDLLGRITNLSRDIAIPLLVGTPREDAVSREAYYNSAVLLYKDGKIAKRYDKLHLVPFGEYVPFRKVFSFVENFAPSPIGDFKAGSDYTVFNFFIERKSGGDKTRLKFIKNVKFSCLICFEDIFPDMTRRFVNNGALFLVNMTNDAWFGRTNAPYQHAQNSIFRAVENRVNVVRAANTGYSCFIDQKGRVIAQVGEPGRRIFTDGYKICDIVLTKTRTFYTVYGDLFAYLCVIISLLYIVKLRRR
ncbi:MAG: apolipoprotein N-acyltransferase [Candidatus Omnitrophota bacterium]|jgi:apolipoprotein N-acyltransferase